MMHAIKVTVFVLLMIGTVCLEAFFFWDIIRMWRNRR